jgi:hypothetical protein
MATHAGNLSEINPHLALWQSENYVSPTEARWYAWVRAVELKLGHSLDGNQQTDGYSLDYAHDAFADGVTVADYVAEVRAENAALKAARAA